MIVVGAGIIGLSCAWRLSLCKIPVTVFDARESGAEASWAGAGMLAPGGEMQEPSLLTEMALRSLALYPDFVQELREATGAEVDFARSGALELALDDREAQELEARARKQMSLGICSQGASYPGAHAARFYPNDASVNPRDIVAALRVACRHNGVRIREHEPVLEILSHGVRTAAGVCSDDGVLIAAGAWSSLLTTKLPVPATLPVRGHLISYQAERGLLGPILRHENTYLLQRASGALIAGTSTEHVGFDRTIDESTVQAIHNRASHLLPALSTMEPAERWIGFRPGIAGGLPAVGRIEGTNFWTAFGHYRNGILLAPDTACRIVESFTQTH